MQNSKQFGLGSSASKLIRQAFQDLIFPRSATTLHNRLSETIRKIIRSSTDTAEGYEIAKGNLNLLKGFELNGHTPLQAIFAVEPELQMDPRGQIQIIFPPLKFRLHLMPLPTRTPLSSA